MNTPNSITNSGNPTAPPHLRTALVRVLVLLLTSVSTFNTWPTTKGPSVLPSPQPAATPYRAAAAFRMAARKANPPGTAKDPNEAPDLPAPHA